jgi:hypothetical protein
MPKRNAIPNACIDLNQRSEGVDTCPCRKGHEGTNIGVTFCASSASVLVAAGRLRTSPVPKMTGGNHGRARWQWDFRAVVEAP